MKRDPPYGLLSVQLALPHCPLRHHAHWCLRRENHCQRPRQLRRYSAGGSRSSPARPSETAAACRVDGCRRAKDMVSSSRPLTDSRMPMPIATSRRRPARRRTPHQRQSPEHEAVADQFDQRADPLEQCHERPGQPARRTATQAEGQPRMPAQAFGQAALPAAALAAGVPRSSGHSVQQIGSGR